MRSTSSYRRDSECYTRGEPPKESPSRRGLRRRLVAGMYSILSCVSGEPENDEPLTPLLAVPGDDVEPTVTTLPPRSSPARPRNPREAIRLSSGQRTDTGVSIYIAAAGPESLQMLDARLSATSDTETRDPPHRDPSATKRLPSSFPVRSTDPHPKGTSPKTQPRLLRAVLDIALAKRRSRNAPEAHNDALPPTPSSPGPEPDLVPAQYMIPYQQPRPVASAAVLEAVAPALIKWRFHTFYSQTLNEHTKPHRRVRPSTLLDAVHPVLDTVDWHATAHDLRQRHWLHPRRHRGAHHGVDRSVQQAALATGLDPAQLARAVVAYAFYAARYERKVRCAAAASADHHDYQRWECVAALVEDRQFGDLAQAVGGDVHALENGGVDGVFDDDDGGVEQARMLAAVKRCRDAFFSWLEYAKKEGRKVKVQWRFSRAVREGLHRGLVEERERERGRKRRRETSGVRGGGEEGGDDEEEPDLSE